MPIVRTKEAQLITRLSSDLVGIGNYNVKRDFRRDFDQDMRREGHDYFWPVTTGGFATNPGGQPFPWLVATDPTGEPITLVHHSRRPNGHHTILIGTKTKLWRFYGTEDGEYYETTGPGTPYFAPLPPPDEPYFGISNDPWLLIGSGFSPNGHRWEAIDINGYTVLNNGVDLPMTYRIEDAAVVPIYELRELGIACVGTIGEVNGILLCGDISEIHSEEFQELMGHVGDIDSGNVTASKAGASNNVVTPSDFFTDGTDGTLNHQFRTIVFADGKQRKIIAVVDERTAGVDGDAAEVIAPQRFTLRNKASQAGATFSGLVTASVTAGSATVTASAGFFTGAMDGKTIRFSNGFSGIIDSVTDTTHIQLTTPVPAVEVFSHLPFWITDVNTGTPVNDLLNADADAFTADMKGRYIVFDTGEVRQIMEVITARQVQVDSDGIIASSFFQIENLNSFGAFTDTNAIDRVHYRIIWSMPDEPRRFGSVVLGSIEAGSQVLTLAFPAKSFEVGQEIIVTGAGVTEGNLIATIINVNGLGQSLLLSEKAETTVEDQPVEQLDAFGSIVGFDDLQDDSSAILRIMNLSDVLVIYKDTCMFTAHYTGSVENPFDFVRLKMPTGLTLYYRWTLVDVGGLFHVYAGANAFYKFDLASRVPAAINELELVSDLFFDQATLERTDDIWGANNGVTKEIFFTFPGTEVQDRVICFDYKYSTVSTSAMAITAAATVRRPSRGTELTEDLFVMGNAQGTVLTYGRSEAAQSSWGLVKEIFFRRDAYPFQVSHGSYDSVMRSGLGDFGDPQNVKNVTGMVLYLASQSPNCGLKYFLYGVRNVDEEPRLLLQEWLQSPKTNNLIPGFVQDNYFRFEIRIGGMNNPCRIAGHSFTPQVVGSMDHERRP